MQAEQAADGAALTFEQGLPGFPGRRTLTLAPLPDDPDGPWSTLEDPDDPAVRFLVAPPGLFFPDYVVELDDDDADALGLEEPDDALVLVVVRVEPDRAPTANLLGPVVAHARTGDARQVVLTDSGWSTAEPLVGEG